MHRWTAAALALCLAACNQQVEIPNAFSIATWPGPALRMECRQGECYWQQRQSATVLERRGDDVLVKLVGRSGNSTHLDALESGEYPSDPAEAGIEWRPQVLYILCSTTRPSVLTESDDKFLLDVIDLGGSLGFQSAAANEYIFACHGLAPENWDADLLVRLGYGKIPDSGQSRYPTLEVGLEAMKR